MRANVIYPMTRMLSPTRLLSVAGFALLCLALALGYASAQSVPAAPTIDSVSSGDTTLTAAWTAPAGETGITAYDVRHIETSADETMDSNWTEVDNAWTSGTLELEYTIIGLTNGTEYDVQVRAVNAHRRWNLVRTLRSGRLRLPCSHYRFRSRRRPSCAGFLERSHRNHHRRCGLRRALHRHQRG